MSKDANGTTEPPPPLAAEPAGDGAARSAKAGFSDLVVVCGKCAKRQGFAKRAVRGLLKRELKRRGLGRAARVVEGGCLGPCPKRAIAVATSASLARHRVLLIDPAWSPDRAVEALLPGMGRRPVKAAPN